MGFNNNIVDILKNYDTFITFSNDEGISRSLLEALCVGLPIITTNTSGVDECVFDGKNGPYSEDDLVCPISVYGETKLASERILLNHDPDHLVIRGNVLYDETTFTKASFLNWVVNSLRNNQEIRVVDDQFNNPTWTGSMADIIELCIQNSVSGIVHWGDSDHLNRFDFAKMIADKYELKSSLIKPISTQELGQAAQRPLKSGLVTDKLVKCLNVVPPTIDDCLNAILEKQPK